MFLKRLLSIKPNVRRVRSQILITLLLAGLGLWFGVQALAAGTHATTITHTVCASGCDFSSIQVAIDTASAGDILGLAAETFTETITIDKSLTILGADRDSTIVQAASVPGIASSRVITVTSGVTVTIGNITIRYGVAQETFFDFGDGGGIFSQGALTLVHSTVLGNTSVAFGGGISGYGDTTLTDVTIYGNVAADGGGVYCGSGNMTLTDVIISGNEASSSGGGMDSMCARPELTNVTFSNNTAASDGGGISISTLTFTDGANLTTVRFTENTAGHYGGGMSNRNATPNLTNVVFSGNSAIKGGGVHNDTSTPSFERVVFSGNLATLDGGGAYEYQSNSTFLDTVFYGNSAGNWGGGVMEQDSDSTFTNVLFSGNHATGRGGAMYNLSSNGDFINVTIVNNSANQSGDGIYNQDSNPVLANVIYWGNVGQYGETSIHNDSNSSPIIKYSNMQGCGGSANWEFSCGRNWGCNIDADPLFAREPDPGDGDWTTLEDNDYGNLHLQLGSPAVDAGSNAYCPDNDLDRVPRPQGPRCEMGPYEFSGYSTCIVDLIGASYYRDIQSAIDDDQCQTIYVNPGHYHENVDITRTVTLLGSPGVTVDGDGLDSVFTIHSGVTVTIENMAITNGLDNEGGCIQNSGTLMLYNASLEFCEARNYGGGIYNSGTLLMENVQVSTSQALYGGGIYSVSGSPVSISDSLIFNNQAAYIGGGIAGKDNHSPPEGRIVIDNSQIMENQANFGGGLWVADLAECIIANSEIDLNTASDDGGGIYAYDAPLFIKDTLVTHNHASGEGGGIFARSNLAMIHTTLEYNHADGGGGGLSSVGGDTVITATTISRNTAPNGGGMQTGGNIQASIENSTIISNTASNSGGGLYIDYGGAITITDSTIQDNTATHTGGGIGRDTPDYGDLYLRIRRSTIENNQAEIGGGIYYVGGRWDLIEFDIKYTNILNNRSTNGAGGGIYFNIDWHGWDSYLKLNSSTINGNRATGDGAGVAITGSQFKSTNSTYSWNFAEGNGGGIFIAPLNFSTADLKSLTITRNKADNDQDEVGDGGGLYRQSASGAVTVTASIIAGNRDRSIAGDDAADCDGNFSTGGFNIIGNDHSCTGWFSLDIVGQPGSLVDPMLLPLADNGGPTWTHEPEPDSPAIDNNLWANCPNKDQRGLQRPQDGDGNNDPVCDIGAFELGTCDSPIAPTLSVARDGQDVLLTWNEDSANREYVVARVTDYIQLTNLFSTTVQNDTYTDYGAIGDYQNNYVYLVRGENACGERSARSNKVAEFDFLIDDTSGQIPTTTNPTSLRFILLTIPLTGNDLPTSADALADYIDPNGSVKGVGKWNAQTQSWIIRRVGSPFGTDDFAVAPGDVLAIGVNDSAPASFAFVGDTPANGSIQNTLTQEAINAIIVPLDQSGNFVMDADGLAGAIGGVARVAVWSPFEQRWYVRNTNTGSGPNFSIQLGMPYAIYANDSAPPVWP
ncbi:MAG: hypothetical protein GY832_19645 [Chloroflexi bacterium]|nr:hypothetical protein [Chloroflexota bacterium]